MFEVSLSVYMTFPICVPWDHLTLCRGKRPWRAWTSWRLVLALLSSPFSFVTPFDLYFYILGTSFHSAHHILFTLDIYFLFLFLSLFSLFFNHLKHVDFSVC